jgi:hypothetical protein
MIGYPIYSELSTSSTKDFRPIENNELFLLDTWDQFKSLGEFTSCIIQSDQFSFAYFTISCSTFIQSMPKFQYFIQSSTADLPSCSMTQSTVLPYPLTNPLQLLYQESFWNELIAIYFTEVHPKCPLFSIKAFDHKKASPLLLSAMHYCAYKFMKVQPSELTEYMEKYKEQNIKKIVKKVSIDSLRALVIHTYMAHWGGQIELTKSLESHVCRMSYLLGLHLNYKNMASIDRYNRKVLLRLILRANRNLSGSLCFTPNRLIELEKDHDILYNQKWQIPSSHSLIHSPNQLENQLYSLCLTQFFKFTDIAGITIWFPSFFKLEMATFNLIWQSKVDTLKDIFENTLQGFEILKIKHKDFKSSIESFEVQVKMQYHEAVIELYELLKQKNKSLKPKEISCILNHCNGLYKVLIMHKNYSPYFLFFAHIVGLHYLNIYPKCSNTEKLKTKQKLKYLLLFMKDKLYSQYSLNYLILKMGYDTLSDENKN